MKKHNKQKSFTLIELMTVIGIIAILAGLMLVGYNIFFSEANIGSSMRFDSSIHHSLGYALVGDWKLDDNAANSTVVDTSGNGNDGTFYSSSTEDNTANHSVDGANGRALEFDGVDDYIKISHNKDFDGTHDLTFSFWLKSYSNTESSAIFAKVPSGSNKDWYARPLDSNQIRVTWENDGVSEQFYTTINSFLTNKWYHLVIVWNKDQQHIKIYLNNKKETDEIANTAMPGTESWISIGGFYSDCYNQWTFNGTIDQVRIYKAALSTSQIKQQYYPGLQRLYKKGLISRKEYIKRIVQK